MLTKPRFPVPFEQSNNPRSARLSHKRKEYRARLISTKLREANEKLGALDWEVHNESALMLDGCTKYIHIAATDCGFDGTV